MSDNYNRKKLQEEQAAKARERAQELADRITAEKNFTASKPMFVENTMNAMNTPKAEWNGSTTEWVEMSPTARSRRRSIGDMAKTVDTPGFWVHVESNIDGVPKSCTLIEVNADVTRWRIVGETEMKLIERLSQNGAYIYLW